MPNDCVRYVLEFFRLSAYIILCHCREIFYGHRWLEDSRFFSPMVTLSFGHVFIGDFVFQHEWSCTDRPSVEILFKGVCTYIDGRILTIDT